MSRAPLNVYEMELNANVVELNAKVNAQRDRHLNGVALGPAWSAAPGQPPGPIITKTVERLDVAPEIATFLKQRDAAAYIDPRRVRHPLGELASAPEPSPKALEDGSPYIVPALAPHPVVIDAEPAEPNSQ